MLGFGAFYLFNRVVLQHIQEWQVITQYYKNRMIDLGLRAGLSLTIGLLSSCSNTSPMRTIAARNMR